MSLNQVVEDVFCPADVLKFPLRLLSGGELFVEALSVKMVMFAMPLIAMSIQTDLH